MNRTAACVVALLAVFLFGTASAVRAQEEGGSEEAISAYAVARVKVIDGTVWVRLSEGGDWEEYPTNSPIPPRRRISVPEGSEAELQFHGGQFVLLTSGTDLEIRDMVERECTFRLRAGEIRFDLPADDFAPVTVRVPGGGLARFPEPGRYWLTVTDSDETELVVRRGNAVVTLGDDQVRVRGGQEAAIGRDVTVEQYQGDAEDVEMEPPPAEADRRDDAPPVVVNELQEYGEWITVPTYGYVWRPRVAVGWSPYVYGRWVWIPPYGWTWVSYEPWGWYPYRCGYWLDDPAFGWIWSPYGSFVSVNFVFGSFRHHHHNMFFRPSTVRFVPEGRGVRWVPLRPGESYRTPEIRRGDSRLSGWNRPLDSGRVFVRGGTDRREWRDWNTVHTEQQVQVRKVREAQPRTDTRSIRPETTGGRSPAAVKGGKGVAPRTTGEGVGRGRETVPKAGRTIEQRKVTPGVKEAPDGSGERSREKIAPRVAPSRPVERQAVPEAGPDTDRQGGPPDRPAVDRGAPQDRAPAGRGYDPGTRGRDIRGDDAGRGGGDRGGGDRGGGRGR